VSPAARLFSPHARSTPAPLALFSALAIEARAPRPNFPRSRSTPATRALFSSLALEARAFRRAYDAGP